MTPEELIKKQREQIEELQKKIASIMPDADKLNGVLSAFQTIPELGKMQQTTKDLDKFAKAFEPIIKILGNLDKKTIDKILATKTNEK
ncbi:MAG TPA: hypothetical protein VJ184_00160 [Chryseolinea sp.]|nr:hypothetical protein [Chryseolinea sp.]